jgi:hypothetical protein
MTNIWIEPKPQSRFREKKNSVAVAFSGTSAQGVCRMFCDVYEVTYLETNAKLYENGVGHALPHQVSAIIIVYVISILYKNIIINCFDIFDLINLYLYIYLYSD